MEFIKTLIKNRKLAFKLGKNDFRNRFASTSLGAIWGFISPFIFMLTYVIVFQYILKQEVQVLIHIWYGFYQECLCGCSLVIVF